MRKTKAAPSQPPHTVTISHCTFSGPSCDGSVIGLLAEAALANSHAIRSLADSLAKPPPAVNIVNGTYSPPLDVEK
jgi:hypothetical protein